MKKQLLVMTKAFLLILGIMVMQLGAQAQSTNLAPSAVASAAPACNTGPCTTLNDLSYGTCGAQQMWITSAATNPGSAVNVTFTWTSTQIISGLTIHVGESGTRFLGGGTIQIYDVGTSTWVNHHAFTQALGVCNYDINFNPVATTAIRIVDIVVIGSQTSNVNFREIEVWQGSLSNNDIGAATVDSLGVVCSTTAIPVYATVSNFGKNAITSFNVNWSINGALQVPVSWTGTMDTIGGTAGPSSVPVYLGTHIFTTAGQTIKVWTAQPNGIADTTKGNDTARIVKARAVPAGVYTIGGVSPDYANFTAAVNDLKLRGICGPVHFTVRPGTYNEQVEIDKNIDGSSLVNTITFEGTDKNTTILTRSGSTDLVKRHTLLISGAKYITFRNLTIQGEGNVANQTSYTINITGQNTSNIGIKNCIVQIVGTDAVGSTSTYYIPIVIGGNSSSYSTSGAHHNIEIDSNIINNGYFGVVHYGLSTDLNRDNTFTKNIINNQYYYGYFITNYNNPKIEDNTFNLRNATTGVTPVYVSTATADTSRFISIQRNRINGFGTYAMYLSSVSNAIGTKGFVFNNELVDNRSTTGYGIYMTSCSRLMIHHNSINMNMAGTTTQTYAGLYITGGTEKSVINNNLARTAAGVGYPMYIATTAAVDTVNYNNYFKADTSNGLIYRGSAFYPATYRVSALADSNSTYNDPGFISATNLALTSGCYNGTNSALVTTDKLGNPRALIPDVGAFEFNTVGTDLTIEAITSPTAPIVLGYNDVMVRVKNVGANIISQFDIAYTNNGGTPVTQTIYHTLNPCDTFTVLFGGAQQVDLINVNTLKVYTSNPNGLADDKPANDTTVALYYSPLSGTFTIGGPGANFNSFAQAISVLKSAGMNGPVEFVVNAGTYNERVVVSGPISGLSDVNNLVFRGVSQSTVNVVENVGSGAVFMVNQLKYVTVRDLTVTNNSASGTGIAIVASGVDNSGTGCKVIGCKVDMPNASTSTSYGILVSANTAGYGITAMRADSVQIDSNIVNNGYYGIVIYGATNASYNKHNYVRNNVLNQIYYMGGYIAYNYGPTIVTDNVFDMNTAYGYYGLYYYSNQNPDTATSNLVSGNKVYNYGYTGIYAYRPTDNTTTSKPAIISNNMVVSGTSYGGTYGIYVSDNASGTSYVLHNTALNRYGNTSNTSAVLYTTASSNVVVKNNILFQGNGAGTCYYAGTNPTSGNVNYNLYYNTANANVLYRGGVYYNTSNFKTIAAGGDTSWYQNPEFVSNNDLHVTNSCTPRGADFTAMVPTDIDGLVRSTSPMVGADEMGAFADNIEVVAITSPSIPMTVGAQDVRVLVKNAGNTTVYSFNIAYKHNANAVKTMSFSGLLAPCDTVTMVFTGVDQATLISGANTISAYVSSPNGLADGDPSNDSLVNTMSPPLSGTYVIGVAPSDFTTIGAAQAALNARGVAGPVVFNIKTGVYNESVTFETALGMSAVNTVTYQSQANDPNAVLWTHQAVTGTPTQTITLLGSYFNFKDLTIEQTSTTVTVSTILVAGSINNDTIDNCVIKAPVYGVNGTNTSYTIYGTGLRSNGLTITNNRLTGSYYGIYLYNTTYTIKNTTIENNTFDSMAYGAIYYLYYTTGTKIINNTFTFRSLNASFPTTAYHYWYYNDSGYVNTNNKTIMASSKTLYWYHYYSRNEVSNPARYYNNIVDAGATGGIYHYFGNSITNNFKIHHNSFRMGGGYLYVSQTGLTGVEVMNNIMTGTTTYAYYMTAAPGAVSAFKSDYNLVWTSVAAATPYYAGAARSIAQMKSMSPAHEQNSVSYRAPFTNNTNLMPNVNDSAIWLINGRGKDSTGVTTDITGAARPVVITDGAADLGAYEVTPAAGVLAPLATVSPDTIFAGGTQHFLLGGDSVASITWDAFSMALPTKVNFRYHTGEPILLQGSQGGVTRAYWDLVTEGPGLYSYEVVLKNKPTLLNTVPSLTNSRSAYAAATTWTNNIGSASTVDSTVRGVVITPAMSLENGRYTITDDMNPIVSFLTINTHPESQTKCLGDSALFIVDAIGSSITYQWQEKLAGVWTNISGQTNDSLKITGLSSALNGREYRCDIGSALGAAVSNSAVLTVGVATAISTQPVNATACEGENVVFNTASAGTALTYQWQENTGGGFVDIIGATSTSLTRSFINSTLNGYTYRANITGACGLATTNAASLTVNTVISVGVQPTPAVTNTCAGSSVMVHMAATGVQSYQWQINTGTGFFNIAGATDDTLNIASIPAEYDGGTIRCALVGACNITFSNTAVFNVQTPGKWMGTTSSAWATSTNWGCGIIPGPSSNVIIPASAVNMPILGASVTINNLTIEAGASITLSSGAVLNTTGNVVNNGTIINSGASFVFTGTASQSFTAGTYNGKVAVNNAAGVVLGGAWVLNDTLTLTNGKVTLGNYGLTVGNTGAINGANSSRYIVTDGMGALTINNIGATGRSGAVVFPVGYNGTLYNPATITNTGTNDNFTVRAFQGAYSSYLSGQPVLSSAVTSNVIDVSWMIDEAVAGGSTATVQVEWSASQELAGFSRTACYVTRYNGVWNATAPGAAAGTNPYTKNVTGLTAFSPFTVGSNGTLPVSLIAFTGKAMGKNTLLNWSTASEINNNRFEIERSLDGKHYSFVGKVDGNNNSNKVNNYQFVDRNVNAKGNVYYRLVQVDNDGTKHNSGTVVVNFEGANAKTLVAPNPFTNEFKVILSDMGSHTLTVRDMTGKVIVIKTVSDTETVTFDELGDLSSGVYFLNIDGESTIKVVKM